MDISIHALRGEGDLLLKFIGVWISIFQSTPSVGRATIYRGNKLVYIFISIHALRGEGDNRVAL